MHETLIQYIQTHSSTPLTPDDITLIKSLFVAKKFRKRQFFSQEGEVSKYTAFIVKGAMRTYSVDEKGIEHIVMLSIENGWAGDRESFITGIPSVYFVDAWEATDALVISKENYIKLLSIPAAIELEKKLVNEHDFATQRRVHKVISLSAEERYFDLEKTHPEFLQRFPLQIIASYLGITRETLSRIRSQKFKK